MRFYDRKRELERLNSIREVAFRDHSQLVALTGRRRIGKTSLILKSCEGTPTVYLFVSRENEAMLCRRFARIIQQALPGCYVPGSIDHFEELFRILMEIGKTIAFNLVIDEFQEFLYINPTIYADIQDVWDRERRNSKINFVVSGSVFTLMEKIFKDEKQALFGRADLSLTLEAFRTDVLKEIMEDHKNNYANEDLLALYSFTGGVPKYVELFMDNGCTDMDSMVDYLTRPDSLFFDEGKNMLIQEFGKQYSTYFSILGLIASGDVTLPQIEGRLGEKSIGGQMKLLEEEYRLIKKKRPIRAKDSSKSVRYEINDVFLRFWFRYFYRYRNLIEIKNYSALASIIRNDYPTYSGRILERWFRQKLMESQQYMEIGSWWHPRRGSTGKETENEIDLVAVDLEGRVSAFEVKRNRKKYSEALLRVKVCDMQSSAFGQSEISTGCLSLEDM